MAPFLNDSCAGSFGAYAGPSSAILGLSWNILGPSWCHLGLFWQFLAHLGVILGPCWGHSGPAFHMGIRSVWWFLFWTVVVLVLLGPMLELPLPSSGCLGTS